MPLVNDKLNSFKKSILEIISKYDNFINEENTKQPEVRSGDKIRKDIYKVFNGKIGSKPDGQEWLDNIYKNGEIRYKNNIPLGYKDKIKSNSDDNLFSYSNLNYNSQFGDLIIWNQIIEKAKDSEIKNVIFISDDMKEDWMYIVNSNGKKVIGCRAELREEIFTKSNINNFIILQSHEFIRKYNKISKTQIDVNSIEEIEKTSHYEIIEDHSYSDLINKMMNQKTFSDLIANQTTYSDLLTTQKTYSDFIDKVMNYHINNKKELE
ncbi:PIN-like domain-containing protein [Aliarcobacter cryaerophilus]|uniref:PIN-like domain-containing protein n=1 Tax=Aliarcobacter cryaerophilus TaxID=28198 RepID=UPI000826CD07|nr:PIN-like domain-containing protein [Aliarcobacter cryaerophilus]